MCFCTQGSFGVGAILVATGSYTIRKAAEKNRNYIPFAFIPVIFGIQQIIEGFVWIGLLHGIPLLVRAGSLLFTFFAFAFWPFFTPFSMLIVKEEKKPGIDKFLLVLVCLGIIVGAYSYLPVLTGLIQMTTRIVRHSISYDVKVPAILQDINAAIYLFIVIMPFFLVPNIRLRRFAMLMLVFALIASFFFFASAVSVWCFFAAILSLDIAYIINKLPIKKQLSCE
jgi:hypothetical protein